jgi:hypothetical protein
MRNISKRLPQNFLRVIIVSIVIIVLATLLTVVLSGTRKKEISIVSKEEGISFPCPQDPRCEDDLRQIDPNIVRIQAGDCTISDSETAINSREREFLNLINTYREDNNLNPLTLSESLSRAAAWHSKDMADRSVLNHTDSLGRPPVVRVGDCGNNSYLAENIARNMENAQTTTAKVFEQWRTSQGHNENMLRSNARSIGIAESRGSSYYWTTDFSTSQENWDGGTPDADITVTPTTGECSCSAGSKTYACGETTADACTPGGAIFRCVEGNLWEEADGVCTATPTSSPITTATITPTAPVTATLTQTPSPTSSITPTTAPGEMRVALLLSIPGVGSNASLGENANPNPAFRNVDFKIFAVSGSLVKEGRIVVNFDSASSAFKGTVSIQDLQSGVYSMKVRFDNSLWKAMNGLNLTSGQTTSTPELKLVLGDLNGDNRLDLLDYNLFLVCYVVDFLSSGGLSCKEGQKADLNMDGKIEEIDLNIFYSVLKTRTGD